MTLCKRATGNIFHERYVGVFRVGSFFDLSSCFIFALVILMTFVIRRERFIAFHHCI